MPLPVVTAAELLERKKHILSVDLSSDTTKAPTEPLSRPLHSYQTGDKNLYELVMDKWDDENHYLMDRYNRRIYDITHQGTTPKEQQSDAIGHAAHDYIQTREAVQSDFARQAVLAALYVKRQEKNAPAVKRIHSKLSALLLTGALLSVALVGHDVVKNKDGLSKSVKIALTTTGILGLAGMALHAEQRHIHKQGIKIKSNLMCWHHMSPTQKYAVYDDIMAPKNMGLCGFLDTFQSTR